MASEVLFATAIFVLVLALGWAESSQNSLKFVSRSETRQNRLTFHPRDSSRYTDCHERWKTGERESGVYTIYPNGTYPVQVFCNHTETASYTVIQRRMYGNENFYRGWADYRNGFGNAQGDYWAGLETIYHLAKSGKAILRIDLQDWHGNNRYMQYNQFSIANEKLRYRLLIGKASGQLVDDMAFSNSMMFYTYDSPDVNYCASHQKVGWWYNYCSYALLNGLYYQGGPYTPSGGFYDGLYWKDWMGYGYSLRFASMMLYQ